MSLSLAGVYQTENSILALEALKLLAKRGYPTTCEQRYAGLKKTHWDGRLTIIHRDPLFIVDGAHNPAAADMLEAFCTGNISKTAPCILLWVFLRTKIILILSESSALMQKRSLPSRLRIIPRALPAEELAEAIRPCNPHVSVAR